jgi:hypothetical protein
MSDIEHYLITVSNGQEDYHAYLMADADKIKNNKNFFTKAYDMLLDLSQASLPIILKSKLTESWSEVRNIFIDEAGDRKLEGNNDIVKLLAEGDKKGFVIIFMSLPCTDDNSKRLIAIH